MLLLVGGCALAGCAKTEPRVRIQELPPVCVALGPEALQAERRPSVGNRELTDREVVRVISPAGRVIRAHEAPMVELGEMERARVANRCLSELP